MSIAHIVTRGIGPDAAIKGILTAGILGGAPNVTVYISTTGDDARTYAQAQSVSTPWANPLKADASATAGDAVSIASGTYLSTSYTGAPTFHSFAKRLTYSAATLGAVTLTGASASYVGRISASLAAGNLGFTGLVFDAANAAGKAFEIGDPGAKAWNVTWTSCEFANGTNYGFNHINGAGGTYTTVDCTFSGGFSQAGIGNSATTLAVSSNLTILHTRPVLEALSANSIKGIFQDCTTVTNTVSYTVDGATGEVETSGAATNAFGVQLRCPGVTVTNANWLTITAPAASTGSCYGIYILPNAVNITGVVLTGNRIQFNAPGGYAISYGDSTAVGTGTLTGGTVTGNETSGQYYASKTPHGFVLGRETSVSSFTENVSRDMYANFLASRTTSGTGAGNVSHDSYGADFYAKGCTAFTWSGNLAIQTGAYARRNLAPFAIDSQAGTLTTATTFSGNTFLCAEADTARINALGNITVNNSGTFSGNIYIIPDTISDATDLFYVGGSEGGISGATAYNLTEWASGTAGSVSATNGTGTISVSGEQFIKLPLASIQAMASTCIPTLGANGTTLTLQFGEPLTVGAGGSTGFTLTPTNGGAAATLSYASGSGTTTFVVTASRVLTRNELATIGYTNPGNGLEDAAGVDFGSFSGTPIINDSTQNNAPTDISLNSTTVSVNGGANAVVGILSTTDADPGDTHTYTLVAGTGDTDNASFNISGANLRCDDPSGMTPGAYFVRIQTSDGALTYAEAFSIFVIEPGTVAIFNRGLIITDIIQPVVREVIQ